MSKVEVFGESNYILPVVELKYERAKTASEISFFPFAVSSRCWRCGCGR